MKKKKAMVLTVLSIALMMAFAITASAANSTDWAVPGDFATIQAAIDSPLVVDGDRVLVGPGSFAGATVTKELEIKGIGGAVINAGIALPFIPGDVGFPIEATGSGATISHFYFDEAVAFPVLSFGSNDVTVAHNTMIKPIQGVTNLAGYRWEIHHNEIIDLRTISGGGIAIVILGIGNTLADNIVSHNKIHGTVYVSAGDSGGYNAVGIIIQAIGPGGTIEFNRVSKNNVGLISDTPLTVDVAGIELSEVFGASGVIVDNNVGFNDLRDMVTSIGQIQLLPATLDDPINRISRNLGNNRGHGLRPCAFTGQELDPNQC